MMPAVPPLRLVQTAVAGLVAGYLLLVVLNNTTDYFANFGFMQQVAAMADTFSPVNHWRSVTQPWAIHLFYWIIIGLEALGAYWCGKSCWLMWRNRHAAAALFQQAKTPAVYGLLAGLILWLGIFVGIGGEWFLMWQSEETNALDTAFHLTEIFGICLLLLLKNEAPAQL